MSLQLKSLLSRAVDNLDVSLAALGCLMALPLTIYCHIVISSPLFTTVGVIVLIACLAYLLSRRRGHICIDRQFAAPHQMYALLNIIFFALFAYSLIALHMRSELYARPLGYFIATAATAAILAIEIVFLPSRKSAAYFALFKIVVIGLSVVWSQLLIYPSVIGVDPWEHQMFTRAMLEAGHTTVGHRYAHLPGVHLLIGQASLITGLEYKMAALSSVSLLQVVCNVLFVSLLGRFVHSTKAGLLAALLLGVADWHLRLAYWAIPNSMAVVFIPVVIYLLFKVRQDRPKTSICLSALVVAALMLTHTVAVVMLVMAFFSIWLGFEIYRRLLQQPVPEARIFLVGALAFAVASIGFWTIVSGHISVLLRLLEDLREVFLAIFATGTDPPAVGLPPLQEAVAQYRDRVVPVGEHLFNNLGSFLFFAFSLIGGFAMLSRSMRTSYGYALAICGLVILSLTLFVMFPLRGWLAGRFSYFLQIVLAVPLGVSLLWLASLPVRRLTGALLVGMVVLALSFLMTMSLQANLDNRSLSPNTIVRYGFTASELEAMNTAANLYKGRIAGDRVYWHLGYSPELDGRITNICDQLYSRDFTRSHDMLVLIRQEIVVNPIKVGEFAPFRLDYDPRQALTEQGFSMVYNVGSVSGFIR